MTSMEWIQLIGMSLHGNIYLWWWRSQQSVERKGLRIFRFCVMLGKMNENPQSNTDKLTWFKSSSQYRALDTIDGEPMEFEWNIFPGFTTLQLCNKVLSKMSEEPEELTGRIIFMSMFNDISWRCKDNEQECELSASLVSIYARRFSPGRWSFLGPGSEKKWYSTYIDSKPQGEWDRVTVEEQNGRRRRPQEKISILYWSISTRNSWSPSSSRQDAISLIRHYRTMY